MQPASCQNHIVILMIPALTPHSLVGSLTSSDVRATCETVNIGDQVRRTRGQITSSQTTNNGGSGGGGLKVLKIIGLSINAKKNRESQSNYHREWDDEFRTPTGALNCNKVVEAYAKLLALTYAERIGLIKHLDDNQTLLELEQMKHKQEQMKLDREQRLQRLERLFQ